MAPMEAYSKDRAGGLSGGVTFCLSLLLWAAAGEAKAWGLGGSFSVMAGFAEVGKSGV